MAGKIDDIKKNLEVIKDTSTSIINSIEGCLESMKMINHLEIEAENRALQVENAIKETRLKREHHRRRM